MHGLMEHSSWQWQLYNANALFLAPFHHSLRLGRFGVSLIAPFRHFLNSENFEKCQAQKKYGVVKRESMSRISGLMVSFVTYSVFS